MSVTLGNLFGSLEGKAKEILILIKICLAFILVILSLIIQDQ
jgi:hypothetical protein